MKLLHASACVSLFFMLSGCETISNWADGVGEHMPVIGERCENWQCFTEAGRQASEEKKRMKQLQQQQAQQQPQSQPQSQPDTQLQQYQQLPPGQIPQ